MRAGRRSSRKGENERKERLKYRKDKVSLDLLIKPPQATTKSCLRPLRAAHLRVNRAGLQGWQNNSLVVWCKTVLFYLLVLNLGSPHFS